ncbi:transcription elongation factor A N-terminal and central domain-containing protein 2 [Galendromus occidentalis]|uniref:Transcription elongation factor A N-terminal and central domain-containing protein 2 n=1 Tax=Galendromus occidentalis TaxID=34638 RepID=A0AAJ6QWW7_9ACAR|nr:transcription elongation factor A N-terminal and central domain-containing protein 2 [Galendromus occidentalis]
MEKYLVKKRAQPDSGGEGPSSSGSSTRKKFSQKRLRDLKGVVILEDIRKAKSFLTDSASTDELLEKTLRNLAKKIPGRDILLETGIGKSVRKLTKHENLSVQAAAKKVFDLWKDHVIHKAKQQKQEVKFDLESQRLRDIARRWFAEALSTTAQDDVVIRLENTIFYSCKRILTAPYRRSCRQIAHKLRKDVILQNRLVAGSIEMEDFVKKYKCSI